MKHNRWQKAFLTALEQTGSVTQACEAAKISRVWVYECRKENKQFAEEWEHALESGADALVDEARRRAFAGSDTLLIFLLKGLQPQRWRESRATIPPAELNRMIEAELQRIAKQREAEDSAPVN
jgi:hypothetical protein